MIWTQ